MADKPADKTIENDDKSYKVTETGADDVEFAVLDRGRNVETDMAEDEVKKFEEDWTNLWDPAHDICKAHY